VQYLFGTARLRARSGLSDPPRILLFTRLSLLLVMGLAAVGNAFPQQISSSSPEAQIARADELLRLGKPKDALATLNQVAAAAPATAHLEARIGKAYFQSNQFQQAVSHLEAALRQDPSDAESTQVLALSYFVLAQYAKSLPLFEKLGPRLARGGPDGPYLLASCYVMTERWNDARKTYAKLLSLPPDSANAYLMFAKFLVRQRLENRAVPEIQAALERDPQVAMAHFLLGEIGLYRGDAQAAVEEFHKELLINPGVWLVYWRLGDAYVRLEKYDDAERALQQAVWLNETTSGPYILLGQVALKREHPWLAAQYLERALRLDAQNDYIHYFLGKAYRALGRAAEADQHFAIAKQLRNNRRSDERTLSQQMNEAAE
jgi:tetratricopeptide (TPR) repeat protein